MFDSGYLYFSSAAAEKLRVIDVEDIECLARKLDSSKYNNIKYILWPEMNISQRLSDTPLG